ncbi:MAG: type 1 glutamine amidotransferase, partial [Caulobacteraceae bacterium]|nr:type 1 glutamine amidotransferase [Caulobacter sp.]
MTDAIGILETGVPPQDLAMRHGRYDAMVRQLLGPGFRFRTYDVQAEELPARPGDHPAYVITGSAAGVYDPLPWIAPLKDFIRRANGRAKLLGICFGHQIMAEALGGRVEKSAKGWGLGLHGYEIVSPTAFMGAMPPARIAVAASHQDQVVEAP